jgi:hypothetical protein
MGAQETTDDGVECAVLYVPLSNLDEYNVQLAVGKVTIAFGRLENMAHWLARGTADVDEAHGTRQGDNALSTSIKIFKRIAKGKRLPSRRPDLAAQLLEAMATLQRLLKQRNELVHSAIGQGPGGPNRYDRYAATTKPVDHAELRRIADEAWELTLSLGQLVWHIQHALLDDESL